MDCKIRVLIDVGAHILDAQNKDIVYKWMNLVTDVDAGMSLDEDDNLIVLTRDQKQEPLATSLYRAMMDRCVIYLDEVHTRGTNLILPGNARAAVTLGPRLTKDRLVQGTEETSTLKALLTSM